MTQYRTWVGWAAMSCAGSRVNGSLEGVVLMEDSVRNASRNRDSTEVVEVKRRRGVLFHLGA
jgi:hypothetical protein